MPKPRHGARRESTVPGGGLASAPQPDDAHAAEPVTNGCEIDLLTWPFGTPTDRQLSLTCASAAYPITWSRRPHVYDQGYAMIYRSALITGGSSGIGAAFARALPMETHLLLTGRDVSRLESVAAPLASSGRRVEILAADLATTQGRAAVIEVAERAAVDLFVCNAGLGTSGSFGSTALSAEREVLAVNVIAVAELLHALIPPMTARAHHAHSRGGIIVVSSVVALGSWPSLASYGATKAFQLYLTQALSQELADEPLDFLCLCPTITRTAFFERAGLSLPARAMSPDVVAREGLAALGRRQLHLCGAGRLPQPVRQLLAFNRALDPRHWYRYLSWRTGQT
jgi:uncharacterized protein